MLALLLKLPIICLSFLCPSVLEIQSLTRALRPLGAGKKCPSLRVTDALGTLQKVINGKGNLRLLDGEVSQADTEVSEPEIWYM